MTWEKLLRWIDFGLTLICVCALSVFICIFPHTQEQYLNLMTNHSVNARCVDVVVPNGTKTHRYYVERIKARNNDHMFSQS